MGELGVATTNTRKVGVEWVCPPLPPTTTTDTLTITRVTKNNLLENDDA